MEPYQDPAARPLPPTQNPELSPEIKDYLLETAKWGKFLGIVGYIFVGLLVLTAIFAGTFLDNFTRSQIDGPVPNAATSGMFSIFMAFYFLLIGLVYFFPSMYIHQFGVKMQIALHHNQQPALTGAFSRLKSFFKFWGIFTIVLMAFYLVGVLMMLLFGAFMNDYR